MNWSMIVWWVLLLLTMGSTVGGLTYVIYYIRRIKTEILTLIEGQNTNLTQFRETLVSQNHMDLTSIVDAIKEDRPLKSVTDAGTELTYIFSKVKQVAGDDLYKTLMKTNACRTAIYLFHNGTRAVNGNFNFIKLSCIGEKCRSGSGIQEQIFYHNNMSVNIFDDMYEILLKTGRYIFLQTADGIMDTFKFISSPKIQYSQAACIYDNHNIVLGFILAEFDHPYDTHTADEEYDKLITLCKNLKPLFSFTDYIELTTKETLTT